ncbi:enolase-like domain-containing protein [Actinotignum schaalii]|uniref:hypothetical protein n=2 Tax=Actinotignum TaxID=1653174 RepID=UPI001F2268FA|nr:hypothetical protein [Actinotignum schaalii]WQN45786.1 hypothetical protein U4A90_03580 [Actinotignum schaalii]
MSKITGVKTYDFRFPTSNTLSGSDAMNPDPDYSSAYVEISTDADDGIIGVGFVFTIGRGNDVVCAAMNSMAHTLVGRNVEELLDNMRLAWDLLVGDSQLRWLGPEKGVEHMAIGALLSALWDISKPSVLESRCGACWAKWNRKSWSQPLISVIFLMRFVLKKLLSS